MSQTTRNEVLKKLRRRYLSAGPEHKRKLLDQAQELLGYPLIRRRPPNPPTACQCTQQSDRLIVSPLDELETE